MANAITLTKENFNTLFYQTTGIVNFPNPFDYEGEEYELYCNRANQYLRTRYDEINYYAPIELVSENSETILTEDNLYIYL